ncbi:MAG: hypothetical protein N2652_10025 [Kiritimatiellae bacterium]|nr:hypothetical protein [Kiritimatiellia bacterium]
MSTGTSADGANGTGRSRRDVVRLVLAFYLAAALLNGRAVLRTAERMEHGGAAQRLWLAAVRPLAAASTTLRIDRFRDALERFAERWYAEPLAADASR